LRYRESDSGMEMKDLKRFLFVGHGAMAVDIVKSQNLYNVF
jgi:hypothetical protein